MALRRDVSLVVIRLLVHLAISRSKVGADWRLMETVGVRQAEVMVSASPFKGLIRPFKGLLRPFKGLIRPFNSLIRPFKGLIGLLKALMRAPEVPGPWEPLGTPGNRRPGDGLEGPKGD